MKYPTTEEVEKADRFSLCEWHRFLPSPGTCAIEKHEFVFNAVLEAEVEIMNLIQKRLKEAGGFTPEISKALGWGKP
jgi:hypothetical protein